MPEDINELDVTDAGLKAVMGDRFHDETQSEKVISKKETTTTRAERTAQKPTRKLRKAYEDAQWEPMKETSYLDTLKGCVKWLFLFGGLSCLIFYWNEAGLMASSIAIPSMCLCTAMAGFGVGKSCVKGDR